MNEDSLEIIEKAISLYPDQKALKWSKAVQLQFLSRFRESDSVLESNKVVELKQFDSHINGQILKQKQGDFTDILDQ